MTNFQKKKSEKFIISIYSILILDVSGSMTNYYNALIELTNDIIKSQKDSEENEGVIIFFAESAKTILNAKYKDIYNNNQLLTIDNINNSEIYTGETNFIPAFKEAKKYINIEKEFIMKRVIFLTDGHDNHFDKNLPNICKEMQRKNFLLHFISFGTSGLSQLNKLPHDYITTKNTFEEIKTYIMKQFAS